MANREQKVWLHCIVQVKFFVYESNVKLTQERGFPCQDKVSSSNSFLVQLSYISHVWLDIEGLGKTVLESQRIGIWRPINHDVVEIFKAFKGYFDWLLVVVILRKLKEMTVRKRSRHNFSLNIHSPRVMNYFPLLIRFPIDNKRSLLSFFQQSNTGKRRNRMKLSINRHSNHSLTSQRFHLDQNNTTHTSIEMNQLDVLRHFVCIDSFQLIKTILFLWD